MTSRINFLKRIFVLSFTSVGTQQSHLSIFLKHFVTDKNFFTEEEFKEFYSVAQLLPGPTSTQLLILAAIKIGGNLFAALCLLVWVLPATLFMGVVALFFSDSHNASLFEYLMYLPILAIAFIIVTSLNLLKQQRFHLTIISYCVVCSFLVYYYFASPFVIPALIIGSGFMSWASKFKNKKVSNLKIEKKTYVIKWRFLSVFFIIYFLFGFISEQSSKNNWRVHDLFNLFETNYRNGSIVYQGIDVLIPVMYNQFVARPEGYFRKFDDSTKPKRNLNIANKESFLIGASIIKLIPGPMFVFAGYVGGLVTNKDGIGHQILAIFISTFAIFLPGYLLACFVFPIWMNLKNYPSIQASLIGFHVSVIPILIGSAFRLTKDTLKIDRLSSQQLLTLLQTPAFYLLIFFIFSLFTKKIPLFFLILICFIVPLIL